MKGIFFQIYAMEGQPLSLLMVFLSTKLRHYEWGISHSHSLVQWHFNASNVSCATGILMAVIILTWAALHQLLKCRLCRRN